MHIMLVEFLIAVNKNSFFPKEEGFGSQGEET